MAFGSIKRAYKVFQQHDYSRQFQIRILDMNNVPSYVYDEVISKEGYVYGTTMSIPGRSIQNIDIPYHGFQFKVPGQVAYDNNPWTWTLTTPGDYLVRNAFERWSFAVNSDETSCGVYQIPCEDTTIDIAVLKPNCEILRVYRLHGVYPQNISEITYDQTGNNTTTFSVAIHYQWWRLVPSYDTGLLDSTASDQSGIDAVYAGYEASVAGDNKCVTGPQVLDNR